jgi:C4-type Zn-finger protein
MPIAGTKLAPEKFKGDYDYVSRFIQHYERLCDHNNVTNQKERCETITQYCSKKVAEFIEALESYSKGDWSQLKKDLLKFYDNDRSSKRYRQKDIVAYTNDTKLKKIKDLSTWKRYARGFVRIGGWLKSKGKISEDEHATYFWQGIPRTLRLRIENRLLAQDPTRSMAKPWEVSKVEAAAEAILQRDRFDRNLIDSDEEENDETDEEDSDNEGDSDDSDSEEELKRLRRKAKQLKEIASLRKAKRKPPIRRKLMDSDDEAQPKKNSTQKNISAGKQGDHQEVEELIKQLNSMSLSDPGYGITYFKAIKMDRDVEKVVRRPGSGVPNNGTMNRIPNQGPRRDPPPHFPLAPQPTGDYVERPPMKCYGCGDIGHGITRCIKIAELINNGVLAKDAAGRVVKGDGTYLQRNMDEPFLAALERERQNSIPKSNYIRFVEPDKTYFIKDEEENSRDDEVEIDHGWVREIDSDGDTEHFVFPVDGKKRELAEKARKRAHDKIYPEPLAPGTAKGKERMGQPPRNKDHEENRHGTRASMRGKELVMTDDPDRIQVPSVIPVPTPVPVKATVPEKHVRIDPIPIEVREREWNPADNEDMIEDRSGVKESGSSSRSLPNPEKAIDRRKPTPRKSAVSAHVDPMAVLTQLLSTPVQLQVGEVLGISKELSGLLNDSIKLKSGKPLVASSFVTRTRGVLIKLHMECDGIPVVAIIDTGSQLNIVSKTIWKSVIKRPMDIAKSLAMNDANGGEGILRGLVQHVPLTCGIVSTEANLYVGEHVPFQLLLGRPWQRGNYVSIDERREGTYLLFKDPRTLEVRYEIMVNPESPDPAWDFDPSVWKIPANLLITVPEHNASASNQERAARGAKARNVGYLIWKSILASASVLQKIASIAVFLILAIFHILVNWLELVYHKLEEKKGIKSEPEEAHLSQNPTSQSPESTDIPIMSYPPSGRIVNTTIREDRTPVVPSTISCSFQDRTDVEIVDRIRSEVPYHRRAGFNNQGIIGSHAATELRPSYESGRLTRHMVLNDAVLITNADNSDPPNVMRGDIILKQYPKPMFSSEAIHFPTYKGPTIPIPHFGSEAQPPQINLDRDSQPFSLYIDLPDRAPSTSDSSQTHVSRTASAGVPLNDSSFPSSPTFSPTLSEVGEPLTFATILRNPANRSPTPFYPTKDPALQTDSSLPLDRSPSESTSLLEIQSSIRDLQAKLEQLQASEQARSRIEGFCERTHTDLETRLPIASDVEEEPHVCERTHEYHSCDDRYGKKSRIVLTEPLVYRSRTIRRKERQRRREAERKRREKEVQESAEEEEVLKRRDDEDQQEVTRVVQDVRKDLGESIRTVKKPFTSVWELDQDLGNSSVRSIRRTPSRREDRLYSDDENSPIRILPPSRRDVIFSGNPNMPALSFHVATPELQYPEPTLFRSPLHTASDLGYGDKIDLPTNVQSVTQEIIDKISKSIQSLQKSSPFESSISTSRPTTPLQSILMGLIGQLSTGQQPASVSCADINDSGSICSSRTHSSMPPLEEISVSSSDSGSDMDLESVNSESHGPTTTHNPEELAQIERDIFGGSESGSEGLYEPRSPARPSRSLIMDSDFSSALSEDRIVEDWDRIPVQEEEDEDRMDENSSNHSMDESIDSSIIEAIAQDAYKAVLHSVSVFLETESPIIDVSHCKFKNGRNPELRNSVPVSASSFNSVEAPIPRQEDFQAPEKSTSETFSINQLGFGNLDSPAQYLARAKPPAYLSTLPRFMQHRPFLRELKGLRRRIAEVIDTVIYSLDTEDWGIVMSESLDILVEHGDAFRELTMRKKDYYREISKCENALMMEKEDHFLRSSASRFRALGRLDLHDAILDILQVRTHHPKIVQQLLTAGYLEPAANDHAALHMLWIFERMDYGQ